MIQPIVVYGDPILRQPCLPYTEGTDVKELVQDLWDTMYNAEGLGLAAPQIGVPLRIFVVSFIQDKDTPFEREWKQAFINPKIVEYKGEDIVMREGCLSIPGTQGSVQRKSKIVIDYYTEDWIYVREEYDGMLSRIIQHEYDHLEGKLWPDRMIRTTPMDSLIIMTSLQHCQRKTVKTNYPIV